MVFIVDLQVVVPILGELMPIPLIFHNSMTVSLAACMATSCRVYGMGRPQAHTVTVIFPFNDKEFRMVPKMPNQTAG
jgi:hypothetical protein